MSFISDEFEYDGIPSYEMGVSLVSLESDLIETPFGYTRDIKEEKIPHRDKPYFYGFEKECLTLKLTIAKLDSEGNPLEWSVDDRIKIVEWLYKDKYCPFISADNPEVIYYCTPVEDGVRFTNRDLKGYATITLRCNSPYAYSPTYIEEYNHATALSDIIEINNLSNVKKYYHPEIQVYTNNTTSFKIVNLTDGGREFSFSNLDNNETIYINNEMQRIETDKVDVLGNKVYRLQNFNKNWFRLVKGINRIQIVGDVDVLFRCSYPISI